MDQVSLLALLEASQSAVESSDLALRAAEEALTAAKSANSQANAALRAVKEFSAGGGETRIDVKKNKCETCRKKKCLHGELLQESLCKDPSGFIVRAIGDSWTSKYMGRVGKIISCNQSKKQKFLNVQWENLSRTENFTFSSKSGPKFVIECKLKPEFPQLQIKEKKIDERDSPLTENCQSCKVNPCQRGNFLTEAFPNPSGLKVRSTGKSFPERYRNALATVIIKQGLNITLRWDNTGEIRENTISSKSGSRFIIECTRVDKNFDTSPVLSSVSTGDLSEVSEQFDNEIEDFIMLSSNKNPIVDLDEDDEIMKTDSLSESFRIAMTLSSKKVQVENIDVDDEKSDSSGRRRILKQVETYIDKDKHSTLFTCLYVCRVERNLIIVDVKNVLSITQYCNSNRFPCLSLYDTASRNMKEAVIERFKNSRSNVLVTTAQIAQDALDLDRSFTFKNVIFFDVPTNINFYRKISNRSQSDVFTLFNDDDDGAFYELFRRNFHTDVSSMKLPPWPFHNIGTSDTLMIYENLSKD